MEFKKLHLPGLVEITPRIFHDSRGHFFETFRQDLFYQNGITQQFVQDNQSFSPAGVVRGLHYQAHPHAQGKLVRVITGQALDVVVDLRKGSPTYGKHAKVLLDSAKGNMLWVPVGFAHGFVAITETIFVYKCTNTYHKESEGGVKWNDPALGIDWEVRNPIVSDKDQELPLLADVDSPFDLSDGA